MREPFQKVLGPVPQEGNPKDIAYKARPFTFGRKVDGPENKQR